MDNQDHLLGYVSILIIRQACKLVRTFVIREIVLHWADGQLFLEPIDLVQEQNDRSLDKPSGVTDGIEKGQGLLHAVDGFVFKQQLVIFGNGDEEKYGGDILKTVNPFLTFRTLATNIEHAICEIPNNEGSLRDSGSLDTGAEHVLVVWNVVRLCDSVDGVEIAKHHIVKICTADTYPVLHENSLFSRIIELIFP